MHIRLARFIVLAALTACSATAAEAATALRFGKMADGSGKSVSDAVIVVDGDKIVSVGSGNAAVPAGATVIDLRKYTAIPGMIDLHTHLPQVWDEAPGTTPYRQAPRTAGETTVMALKNLRLTLEAGVTTARDLSTREEGVDKGGGCLRRAAAQDNDRLNFDGRNLGCYSFAVNHKTPCCGWFSVRVTRSDGIASQSHMQ